MKIIASLIPILVIAGSFCVTATADDARTRAITPFLTGDAAAVGRIDLTKVDLPRLVSFLVKDPSDAQEITNAVSPWLDALRKAGARELYLVFPLPELSGEIALVSSAIVPLEPGADANAIGEILCGRRDVRAPLTWPTCATLNQAVFAGTDEALESVRRVRTQPRPELDAAFGVLGDSGVELIIDPSRDTRKVVEELIPNLPAELGGVPSSVLTQGLRWSAVALYPAAEPHLRVVFQGTDSAATEKLEQVGKKLVQFLNQSAGDATAKGLLEAAGRLKPNRHQDRITIEVTPQDAITWADVISAPTRDKFRKDQAVQSLKFIGLAMHNYLSTHGTFPPAYSVDKDGKSLLSWRVLILPFIEEEALYKEFHLDEPWDSEHNKALIARMPAIYSHPGIGVKINREHKTTFLAFRGPHTIVPGPAGVTLKDITDGTSITLIGFDAPEDEAVIWTKPDDFDVSAGVDLKKLFGPSLRGTSFLMADGAVHYFKNDVNAKIFDVLFTRDGGEVFSLDALYK